jgi:hypothetical protein
MDEMPLSDHEWVQRVCKRKLASKNGELIQEGHFAPSSEEKNSDPKHRLSVWAESLTTEAQAFGFTWTSAEEAVMGRLKVEQIHALRPQPETDSIPHLITEWHYRYVVGEDGSPILDPAPGARGHAGIRDLTLGNKLQTRSLRVQLAQLALEEYETRSTGS